MSSKEVGNMYCAVCSAEITHLTAIDFSSLTARQQRCCSILRTQETTEEEEQADRVICKACFAKIQAFLAGPGETGGATVPDPQNDAQLRNSSRRGPKDPNKKGSPASTDTTQDSSDSKTSGWKKLAMIGIPAIVGGGAAIVAAPLAVAALGFGAGGIAAGSAAAGMMSTAWTTGIGVGVVSTLQSVGAAGMGAAGVAATGGAGAIAGGALGKLGSVITGRSRT